MKLVAQAAPPTVTLTFTVNPSNPNLTTKNTDTLPLPFVVPLSVVFGPG